MELASPSPHAAAGPAGLVATLQSVDSSLQSLLKVMDHLPVGICVTDSEMRILAFNATARRLLDMPDELFADGLPTFESLMLFNAKRGEYGSGDPVELARQRMDIARQSTPFRFERKRPNGTVLDVRGEPLPDGGHVGIWTDITERSFAEEQLAEHNAMLEFINEELSSTQRQLIQSEKMASIGQLAAGVAHEINNPIGFVASNMQTLEGYVGDLLRVAQLAHLSVSQTPQGQLRTDLLAALDRADLEWLGSDIPSLISESREGIDRVKKIVQDLKDFSRPESSDAQWEVADLVGSIRSTASIARNEIKYCADVLDLLPASLEVECLPSSLNQVFLNLLVNAAHAIEAKGPERGQITIAAGSDGRSAWFEIGDNGSGMSEETAGKVFDPFFTTKPVGKGTGLGLAIAHGIVCEKHGGTIEVVSKPGVGSTFRIEVPLSQDSAPRGSNQTRSA